MEVKITSTSDNKLLDRKEIEAEVSFAAATPKRKELQDAIGKKIGANPDFLVLRKVMSEFGIRRVRVSAHAYPSLEALKRVEPRHMQKRSGLPVEEKKKKAKKGGAKKAEAKK